MKTNSKNFTLKKKTNKNNGLTSTIKISNNLESLSSDYPTPVNPPSLTVSSDNT
jgi:hypothetical protein